MLVITLPVFIIIIVIISIIIIIVVIIRTVYHGYLLLLLIIVIVIVIIVTTAAFQEAFLNQKAPNVPLPCLRKDLRTGSISRDVAICVSPRSSVGAEVVP